MMRRDKRHLDCSNPASTLESLAHLFDIEADEITRRIRKFDLNDFLVRNPSVPREPREIVIEHVFGSRDIAEPATITWFHATRVPRNTTFDEGIQPLNLRLDHIWQFLEQLASPWLGADSWSQFRATMEGPDVYYLRKGDPTFWGPYAFLIRELAFLGGECALHNFFDIPEIVEDICQSFEDRYGKDLGSQFRVATCPCLVTFVSDVRWPNVVCHALYYLYLAEWQTSPDICTTCFCAEGQTIPSGDITNIEFFSDLRRKNHRLD